MARIILIFIGIYRKIRPYLVFSGCRYYPSCSHYAEQAIERHGALYGSFLAAKRLIRCNQWFKGGFDPVPEKRKMFHVKHFGG